jgi:hypothetical protein
VRSRISAASLSDGTEARPHCGRQVSRCEVFVWFPSGEMMFASLAEPVQLGRGQCE